MSHLIEKLSRHPMTTPKMTICVVMTAPNLKMSSEMNSYPQKPYRHVSYVYIQAINSFAIFGQFWPTVHCTKKVS